MIASARASYGDRSWVSMSAGKSGGQARSAMDVTGDSRDAERSSRAIAVARDTDARTSCTSVATPCRSRDLPS
jgi:hypothetical protein